MRFITLLVLLAVSFFLSGQTTQERYLNAKNQYNQGNYEGAAQSFTPLIEDLNFGPYATYYLGLSDIKIKRIIQEFLEELG